MKKILIALLFLALPVFADIPAVQTLPPQGPNGDPCLTSGLIKSTVPINISTVTTTQLVAAVNGSGIFVCGFAFTDTGATTSTTVQFEYGSGASCGTGTTVLTGAMAPNSTTTVTGIAVPSGGSIFVAPAATPGNAFCLVTTGTTVSVQGYLTYVQRGL